MSKALTIRALIEAYRSDDVSPYQELRYRTKENYDSLMRRVGEDHGATKISEIKFRTLKEWHKKWTPRGVPMAHSLMGMVRTLVGYGMTYLENDECARVGAILHKSRFEMGKSRVVHLTAEQADAVCRVARAAGYGSLALAQAFQFECAFRQKDVIGEWLPCSEPGISEITARGMKWLRGIRWSEIDDKLILRHVTSKKLKLVEPDLKLCPMVIEELQRIYPSLVVSDAVFDDDDLVQEMTVDRSVLPTSGPIIVFEETARPYETHRFRRLWRALATTASIPKNVQNRDSRAGAATEATGFGADLHDTQHLLAHSDIATTQIYSRGKAEKATKAQRARVVGRKRVEEQKPKLLPYLPGA
jgi:hypothetical protein